MIRFAVVWFISLGLVSAVSGQSGRRVQPVPTPDVKVDDTPSYSESVPQKKRPRYQIPSLRGTGDTNSRANSTSQNIQTATPAEAGSGDDVVTVETNLITIPVSVFDRNGLYIPNLRQTDFTIFEDGKQQEIAYFGTTDKPFTVILLIDTSPSTNYKIEEIRSSAVSFVDQLKMQDQVMVIEFDGNVQVLTEATGDRQKIFKAIGKADFGSGTSLYDAVEFSLGKRLNKIAGRKAIVLFTDGVDTQSRKANYDTSLNLAEESDTLIFPIYYNTFLNEMNRSGSQFPFPSGPPAPGTTAAEYALGKKYLDELASYTGGRVFRPEATPGGLTAAFEGIAEELRRQYNIGYIPGEDGRHGQRKLIKVRVNRPNLVLRSRDSYIVGSEQKMPAVQ
ncbi:MAG: VWA domain-containing protein [Saprospiraceae bacterium]|nr:VWA domain-containing protein [Pyrinomonadaceae bacterium]